MTSSELKVAVILPSRGLMFSQTAEEVLESLRGIPHKLFFSHGLPIPECFEKPLKRALKGSYSHIWFVEDDMILPANTLTDMLKVDSPVVTMDYPVSKKGQGSVIQADGRVLFAGTGCLLVKRAVFDIVRPPYFRTDVKWGAINHGEFIRFTAQPNTRKDVYGLHDVNFSMKLQEASIPISVAGTVGQRKLIKLGEAGTNDGAHQIEQWHKVIPDYLINQIRSYPVMPLGSLVTVQTKDGELNVHPDKAKKLIEAGVATPIPKRSVRFDFGSVQL